MRPKKAFVPSFFTAVFAYMEPAKQLYSIRQPQPGDLTTLADYCNAHNLLGTHLHPHLLAQYLPTTWLCESEDGSMAGALTSCLSPNEYSTAIIVDLAIAADGNTEVVSLLLQAAVQHWQKQCVRHLVTNASIQNNHSLAESFSDFGFVPSQWNGLALLAKRIHPERICLHNKKMRPTMNTANGQVNEETLFEYFQVGDYVWGTYAGGAIARGVLLGKMNANRDLRFFYFQLDNEGNLLQGKSSSSTEFLNDGRITLYENWQWTGSKSGSGNSIIEEIK